MRRTIRHPRQDILNWAALLPYDSFLFRRVADRGRDLLAVGCLERIAAPLCTNEGGATDWTFGHMYYDLFESLEKIPSRHPLERVLPMEHWYIPRWVFEWVGKETLVHVMPGDEAPATKLLHELGGLAMSSALNAKLIWSPITTRERYLVHARSLMDHIQRGDIYEVNYCIQRVADAAHWDPYQAFAHLLRSSRADFAGFHRLGGHYALCASPERFLGFNGTRIFGQPMKGTRPRSSDGAEDVRLAEELGNDPKERSENIMALDVMRNDLSRIAASRSVHVDELCMVRSHPAVHQMTSTVSATLRPGVSPMDAVRSCFPMASMTGAPKHRAIQLIDVHEDQRRGLYSGTMGYFAPDGTADLNVVIRTVLHDANTGRTTLSTGSALTAACDPQREWEECELKARSVIEALWT